MADSTNAANDCDYAAHNDDRKSKSHQADLRPTERDHLPRTRRDCGIQADQRHDQHAVLFGHRSAEFVRRSRYLASGADVSGKDGQDCSNVTECSVSAPGEPSAYEDGGVGNAIRHFIVKLSYFCTAT